MACSLLPMLWSEMGYIKEEGKFVQSQIVRKDRERTVL